MVRSKVRCVVVVAALALAAFSAGVPARAQGAKVTAVGPTASASQDLGAWSRLSGWLTDFWNGGLELFLAAEKQPTPPVSSSCTGDCDRGGGVDPNG